MRKARPLRFTLALALLATAASADVGSPLPTVLLPVDESHLDASFAAFRSDLLLAIEQKNEEHLLGVVSPDIKLSFGGDYGAERFRELWLTPGTETNGSDVWSELGEVLRLGCVREMNGDKEYYAAPYVFSRFPSAYDPFEFAAISKADVPLRAEPQADSAVVVRLSYNIVRVIDDWPRGEPGWNHVQVVGGSEGYVRVEAVRSPIDYRALFERIGGEWKMTVFIAGD